MKYWHNYSAQILMQTFHCNCTFIDFLAASKGRLWLFVFYSTELSSRSPSLKCLSHWFAREHWTLSRENYHGIHRVLRGEGSSSSPEDERSRFKQPSNLAVFRNAGIFLIYYPINKLESTHFKPLQYELKQRRQSVIHGRLHWVENKMVRIVSLSVKNFLLSIAYIYRPTALNAPNLGKRA